MGARGVGGWGGREGEIRVNGSKGGWGLGGQRRGDKSEWEQGVLGVWREGDGEIRMNGRWGDQN